jgi:SAM-dependent methyltransferase
MTQTVIAVGGEPEPNQNIQDYYRQTRDDYRVWSPEGYLHFGYWRAGMNPLRRKAQLESMNDQVFASLGCNGLERGTIADLGCGFGAVSRYGAMRFPKLSFFGLSNSEDHVSIAQEDAANNSQFAYGDYHAVPLTDDSCDGAFFLESLCHSRHPQVAIAEAARIVRPGGRVVIVDGSLRRPISAAPRYLRSIIRSVQDNWAVAAFHELATLKASIEEAGLTLLDTKEWGWRIAPSVAHAPWLTTVHALRLWWRGTATAWQRRHLWACFQSLFLGLHRPWFGYYCLIAQRPPFKLERQSSVATKIRLRAFEKEANRIIKP